MLIAKEVKKTFYRKGAPPLEVLRGVNFEIAAGERIAILGKSGSGKSTLLHILGTLEEPTHGSVTFDGVNIFGFNESKLSAFRNQSLGFVFQLHYLMLEFNALENVMMPALLANQSRKKAAVRAEGLLDKVGLKSRMEHKPGQLSGGEQQRVAIARAMMMKPKMMLTDEMTGNLDPVTGASIFQLVQDLQSETGMALVSVTHDEALAKQYPRILRLEQGLLA